VASTAQKGRGQRLTDGQRLKMTVMLKSKNSPSGRALAREFGVSKIVI